MKAKSRKQQLTERAERFCDRMEAKGPAWDNSHDGYVAGYKAAIRDLRKALQDAPEATSADDCPHVHTDKAVQLFLRPLR